MLKYGPWDLPGFDYFSAKNAYIGSRDRLRFNVSIKDDSFVLLIWFGEKCFEKSEIEFEEHFPPYEESIYKVNDFLTKIYNERKTRG